jgi:hypothetical protein
MIADIRISSGKDEENQGPSLEVGEVGEFTKQKDALIMEGIKLAEQVANKGPNAMSPKETYDHVNQYYDSLAEMQITSSDMANMVRELEEEELNKEGQPQNQAQQTPAQATHPNTQSMEEKKGRWRRFLAPIKGAFDRLRGFTGGIPGKVAEAAKSAYDAITSLPDKIKEGLEKVIEALRELARKFKGLIVRLIEEMFKFLPTLRNLAKEVGYGVKKIEIEIPSIKMSSAGFFGIPIPEISAPKITMSIESDSAESNPPAAAAID